MNNSFIKKLDIMILDMERERRRVQSARTSSSHHSNYVTSKLNDIIRDHSNSNPGDPIKSLGTALSSVASTIEDSFANLENIEGNIVVTIDAYRRVKSALILHENEKKQSEDQSKLIKNKSKVVKSDLDRKPGTRPTSKVATRKKIKKTPTRKKNKPGEKKKSEATEQVS